MSAALSRSIYSSSEICPQLSARDRHHSRVAPPVLGQQAAVGELLIDRRWLEFGLSILLLRTTIGHLAAREGVVDRIDGRGMTP